MFSGTGNTEYIIRKIKTGLEQHGVDLEIFYIEDTQTAEFPFGDYDSIGIAFPVHAFNAPEIVVDFAKNFPETTGKNAFVICTVGEYHFLNLASSKHLIKILSKKGYGVSYEAEYTMPSNFIVKYDEKKVERILSEANSKVPQTVADIINKVRSKRKSSFLAAAAAFIGRAEWLGTKMIGKYYYVTGSCDRCGLCAKNCPHGNIEINDAGHCFGRNCSLCMRCIYLCPRSAIKIRRPLKFFCFDTWYTNDELVIPRKQN